MQRTLLALLCLVSAVVVVPRTADACGGFFCSAVQLVPVQQNAERILFEVNDDGTVTAVVEIRYVGDPADFSWVVPVPDTPVLEVVDGQTLSLLDDATAPSIIPPPVQCTGGGTGGGFGARASGGAAAPEAAGISMGDDGDGVIIEDQGQVGFYDYTVLSATDADALVVWLNDNDYLITPEMEPYVAEYVAASMQFLAMKLQPDAGVGDIAPVRMTYIADQPMVPIQLTAVAAEPEMGVIAMIAAEDRYESENWENLEINIDDVQADPRNGASNYYSLLSWRIDQAGGRAMIPQFSGNTADATQTAQNNWGWDEDTYGDALAYLDGVADRHTTLTRLYTRASSWEMASDPFFAPSDGGALTNVLDLSTRDPVEICATAPNETFEEPCGEMYCGEGASCATTKDGPDGCICPVGFTARLITAPRAMSRTIAPTVVCELLASDLMSSVAEMTDLGFGDDPCADSMCGDKGECIAVNGFGTCSCDEGYAAIDVGGALTCTKAKKIYDADALLWATACSGCSAASSEAGGLALLLLPGLALARRRRP